MRTRLLLPALGCALAVIAGASCNKFLDPQPSDVITSENFYKSATDAVSAVNGAYAQMPYTYLYFFYLGDISGDDLMADPGFGSDGHQLADYTFDKTLWTIDYVWSNEYITINRCNIVLDRVPAIQMEPGLKARVLGEARFLRALSYFTLVSMFGDVPLVTKEITDAKLGVVPRTPKAQVYALIESDLQSAATSLPATYGSSDAGRATSGAALALLGKVYLYLKDYNNAAKYLGQVINSGTYRLNAAFYDNFRIATQNANPENVFSVDYGSPETVTGYIGQVALLFGLPNGFPGGDAYSLELVLPSFVNSFSATDSRGNGASFMTPPYHIKSPFVDSTITWNSPPGAAPHKPLDETDHQNMTSRSWEQQPNYQPIIRYADVLMMYAEAVAEGGTGTAGTASAALDQVRQRGDSMATSTASLGPAAFIDTLRVERRKEFFYEGIRWFDLSRWGILDQTLRKKQAEILTIYPGEFNAVHGVPSALYPIPQTEIHSDPLLSQNPGW
jgi:starch-binding outer membrane protein, SusD/RagB family